MTIAALGWPAAFVCAAVIAAVALVVAVLIWSIFRTGQTAIRSETRQDDRIDDLRREVGDLRARVDQSLPSPE